MRTTNCIKRVQYDVSFFRDAQMIILTKPYNTVHKDKKSGWDLLIDQESETATQYRAEYTSSTSSQQRRVTGAMLWRRHQYMAFAPPVVDMLTMDLHKR
ncbi:MAG: hypothetical protein ACI90V_011301 [Bacillariaceae sp.]|jgi:hypothetical protein